MLEPASAIGIAASLVTLIEFVKNTIGKSRELYHAVDGGTVRNTELRAVLERFSRGLNRFHKCPPRRCYPGDLYRTIATRERDIEPDEFETDLLGLATEVGEVVTQLQRALEKLVVGPSGSKWSCVRQALKTIFKEKELKELEERVNSYRRQIDTTLLFWLQDYVREAAVAREKNHAEVLQSISKADGIDKTHAQAFQTVYEASRGEDEIRESFPTEVLNTIFETERNGDKSQWPAALLENLKFQQLEHRFYAIPEASRRTFSWALKSSQPAQVSADPVVTEGSYVPDLNSMDGILPVCSEDNSHGVNSSLSTSCHWMSIKDWFLTDDALYWVAGKPGAGKSTLLKYLFQHVHTRELASDWRHRSCIRSGAPHVSALSKGHDEVCIAAHFFWNSGAKMQKSKLGLVQTLLYDCINDNPSFAYEYFPEQYERWTQYGADLRPLTQDDLETALDQMLAESGKHFLLLVDGLDEYEGDSTDIADTVLKWARMSNVKLIVACRPWTEFEDRFEGRPVLRIEDLTRNDIMMYIEDKLNASTSFAFKQHFEQANARALVEKIATKAHGVFLWVHVVVDSLLKGLRDGDVMAELNQRVDEVPSELSALFQQILGQLVPEYRAQASELFQFCRAFPEEATLYGVYLAFSYTLDDSVSTEEAVLQPDRLQYYEDIMKKRLYSRCKCFLEVDKQGGGLARIRYLHRTAKDFLEQSQIWDLVESYSPSFHPTAVLSPSLLIQLKTARDDLHDPITQRAGEIAIKAAFHVLDDVHYTIQQKVAFSKEIDTVVRRKWVRMAHATPTYAVSSQSPSQNWLVNFTSGSLPRSNQISNLPNIAREALEKLPQPESIFHLAVAAGLDWYVDARLAEDVRAGRGSYNGESALHFAIEHKIWAVVPVFLRRGWSPNNRTAGCSPWSKLIQTVQTKLHKDGMLTNESQVLGVLEAFIEHNANLSLRLGHTTAEAIVRQLAKSRPMDPCEIERRALNLKLCAALPSNRGLNMTSNFRRPKP